MSWMNAADCSPMESGQYLVVVHFDADNDWFGYACKAATYVTVMKVTVFLDDGTIVVSAPHDETWDDVTYWMPCPELPQ